MWSSRYPSQFTENILAFHPQTRILRPDLIILLTDRMRGLVFTRSPDFKLSFLYPCVENGRARTVWGNSPCAPFLLFTQFVILTSHPLWYTCKINAKYINRYDCALLKWFPKTGHFSLGQGKVASLRWDDPNNMKRILPFGWGNGVYTWRTIGL
jgi:hypothetical protein